MIMKNDRVFKMLAALALAGMLLFSSALAQTVEPYRRALPEDLGGLIFSATVGAYDPADGAFSVTVYEVDAYDPAAITALRAGDTLVFCDAPHTVKSMSQSPMDGLEIAFEDGEELLFDAMEGGILIARNATGDQICMHPAAEIRLKPAADILLTDSSDPEKDQPEITVGLENILTLQAQRSAESIGFDYSVTTVALNAAGEIESILLVYAPWQ